jgi:hypothetical protein
MTQTKVATTLPLTRSGASSERYTGTIIDATPTANPIMTLPAISYPMVSEKAITKLPAVNRTSDAKITGLRPIQSLVGPATSAPMNAPNKASETTSSL